MEGWKSAYSCSELARAVGRHPNTLRLYETWGFVSPVPRDHRGWRVYSPRHRAEAEVAVAALRAGFQDWRGRRSMLQLIRQVVAGDLGAARLTLEGHRQALEAERAAAAEARDILERWRRGERGPARKALGRWNAAHQLGISPDTLRDWERDGLVTPGRGPSNRRLFGAEEMDRLRVVQVMRKAGHSLMALRDILVGGTDPGDLTHARDRWEATLGALSRDTEVLEGWLDTLQGMQEYR